MKLLITQDDPVAVYILKAAFSQYQPLFFDDAAITTKNIKSDSFDLLIADVTEPGGDRLLREAASKDIHCVVYTSADQIGESLCQSVDADAVFYKCQPIKLLTDYIDKVASCASEKSVG